MESNNKTTRLLRSFLINLIRIIIVVSIFLAIRSHQYILIIVSIIAIILTFLPIIIKKFFHRNSLLLFDLALMLSSFGLFYFWEIKGSYSNFIIFSTFMNFFESIILGLIGFTIIHAMFKSIDIDENHFFIAFFSLCFSFSVGTILELIEVGLDLLFKFKPYTIGVPEISIDLIFYMVGAIIVSIAGYISLRKKWPMLISEYLEEITNSKKLSKFFFLNKKENSEEEIMKIIKNGEGDKIEFKSTLRKNLHTNQFDKNIEHAILKTINAYLNTDGGNLLIGVDDKGQIVGINEDNFSTQDHAYRHLVQLVRDHIGSEFSTNIKIKSILINEKHIILVECKKSNKECFLKDNKEEYFYIRHGSLSTPLNGTTLIKYIENNFRK